MTQQRSGSPRIVKFGWGKIEVEGLGRVRDVKLWPGGGRLWDWSEYGTSHGKGIQPGDAEELAEHGCQLVILSTGRFQRLRVAEATITSLRNRGVDVMIADTKEGIKLYNDAVARGLAVGGLFHSTC